MLTRLRKKSLSMPIDKSATQLDALCAIIGPRGYILLPPNFAILSPQKTFSAAWYAWRFANTLAEPISLQLFINSGMNGVTFSDLLPPTLKTMVYGLIIGTVSCFQGMRTRGGTEGVGRSVTSSVVLSSLFIILADVVLVRLILVFFPT
jgi:ABC-type transporter Mla maintaining outer membrane lipid asymmetry permease subunit MlaE